MPRKNSSGIDKARQAITSTIKKSAKENRKAVKKLSAQWQRTRNAAIKQAKKNKDKELVAQWRALRRYGYVDTKASPAIKNLTPSRRRSIAKAFKNANAQAAFKNGRTVRPLERTIITTTTTYRNEKGYEYQVVKQRIKYDLEGHFKFIRPKSKPKIERGIAKTKKGYVIEVESPLSKVRVKKNGVVQETTQYKSGKITIDREGLKGEEILALVEAIENGKFKLPHGKALKMDNFGTPYGNPYQWDGLEFFVERVNYYQNAMPAATFEHWLESTEVHIVAVEPQRKIQ